MEMLEALGRVAQNYGPGAALAVAAAIVLARVYFPKFFDRKDPNPVTREDHEKLLQQLEATRRELATIKTQLTRIHVLAQQQWQQGRSAARTTGTPVEGGS